MDEFDSTITAMMLKGTLTVTSKQAGMINYKVFAVRRIRTVTELGVNWQPGDTGIYANEELVLEILQNIDREGDSAELTIYNEHLK